MRYWIAAALCAATMMSACVSQAADGTVAVKLNERDREYRNTGTIILRDPITGALLGSYEFATGRDSVAAALLLAPMNSAPSGAAMMIHIASVRDG